MSGHGPNYLKDSLHNHPDAYWCADCWKFTLDCSHLVEPLEKKHVPIQSSQFRYAAYDRDRRVLEIGMNTWEAYQFFDVPLRVAVDLVNGADPVTFHDKNIRRRYRFERVRAPERYCRMLLRVLVRGYQLLTGATE